MSPPRKFFIIIYKFYIIRNIPFLVKFKMSFFVTIIITVIADNFKYIQRNNWDAGQSPKKKMLFLLISLVISLKDAFGDFARGGSGKFIEFVKFPWDFV